MRVFIVLMGVILLVYGLAIWSRSEFSLPSFPSCEGPFYTPPETKHERACRVACRLLYECDYYMQDEMQRNMDSEGCVRFCSILPTTDWALCTMEYHKEKGCCGKGFGYCATHLPDPPHDPKEDNRGK